HAAIDEGDRAPGLHREPRAEGEARAEHHRVQKVALQADVLRHRAVVERAGKWRDEVDLSGRAALEEAAARHLDHDLELGRGHGGIVAAAQKYCRKIPLTPFLTLTPVAWPRSGGRRLA